MQPDKEMSEINCDPKLVFDHPYPATKVMFIPDKECKKIDILATIGSTWHFLGLWRCSMFMSMHVASILLLPSFDAHFPYHVYLSSIFLL